MTAEDGKTVSHFLQCLTQVCDTHSGLQKPDNINNNAVTPYEAHLKNAFLTGVKPEVGKAVKDNCAGESCYSN